MSAPQRSGWLAAVLALGLVVRLFVGAQEALHLAEYPFTDDSFYSLNIARNLALGVGPTHDGRQWTNGFQPLYVLLMTPVYWLFAGDRIAPLYVAAIFLSLCSVAACYLLFVLACRTFGARAGYLAIAPLLFTPYAVSLSVNGLETSLYALLVCATALYYAARVRNSEPSAQAAAVCGLLAGLTIWARIDGAFLPAAICLDQLWLQIRSRRPPRFSRSAAGIQVLLFGIPALMALPWLAFNLYLGGSPVPESGQAVRFLSRVYGGFPSGPVPYGYYARNLRVVGDVLFRHFLTEGWFAGWLRQACGLPKGIYYGAASALLLVVLGIPAFRRRHRLAGDGKRLLAGFEQVLFLLLFSGLLSGAYVVYAFGPWFFGRYLFVVAFVVALGGGALADFALAHGLRIRPGDWKDRLAKGFYGVLVLASAASTAVTVRQTPGVSPWCTEIIPWIEQNLPRQAKVGAFQTGYLGYFLEDRPVAALDGVVNGAALEALRENRMIPYVRAAGVDYVVDWRWLTETLLFGRSAAIEHAAVERVATLPGRHPGIDFLVYRVRR